MTTLGDWLEPTAARALAAALVQFLWQGAAVAAALAAVNVVLRHGTARARYGAACAALLLMLALPVFTFLRSDRAAPSEAAGLAEGSAVHRVPSIAAAPAAPSSADAAPWIVAVWIAGVSVLSIRFLGGWFAVERLRRRGIRPVSTDSAERFAALRQRLRVSGPVRLLESTLVEVPTAIGILRPLVLLPAGIATGMTAVQLDSLLAHELAHVRRGDCLASFFQALAETLLFYHPAVWWVSHRIRVERENACDDLAVEATGDAGTYARALLALEERRAARPLLSTAADGGTLWSRIARLLPSSRTEKSPTAGWAAGALVLAGAFFLAAAAEVPAATGAPQATPSSVSVATPAPAPATRQEAATPAPVPRDGASARSRGLLSPSQLVAFRIHGVTPEFVGEIAALGYKKASPDDLVALRVHEVTPQYIAQMTKIFGRQPLDEYAAFRIHGLTPASAQELEAAFGKLSADEALAMRIHGVDAAFVRSFRDAGLSRLSAEEAVALKIHGVTPEFAREIRGLGYPSIDAEELVAFRIHGVTGPFIRSANAQLGGPLSADELIDSRIHGTADDEEEKR